MKNKLLVHNIHSDVIPIHFCTFLASINLGRLFNLQDEKLRRVDKSRFCAVYSELS